MVKSDFFIFGYRKISVPPHSRLRLANLLLRLGISAQLGEGDFLMRERDFRRFRNHAEGIEYTASELYGIPGIISRNRWRYASAVALLLALILNIFLSGLVWDVRISGESRLPEYEIREALAEAGLSVGRRFDSLNMNEIEHALVKSYPKIGWVTVNRRGTVAYVEVVEREGTEEEPEEKLGYANVVAERDGVIDEITVKRGVAMVKAGDVVRAGDVLISGVLPEEAGGGLCYAEGEVWASVSDKITVEVKREGSDTERSEPALSALSVKIFGFSLNIFKKYGNYGEGYAIIDDEEDCVLFDKYRLPVSICRTYAYRETTESVIYTDDRLVEIALVRTRAALATVLCGGDLLKLFTDGRYTEDGYIMQSTVVYMAEVGRDAPILAE
ncbi:MAG: sporulation protein YqfD [Clostridia bacterium]|nr:sporulation protein YqfD [Clostridia bacterium]